jgi:hypothetical protein
MKKTLDLNLGNMAVYKIKEKKYGKHTDSWCRWARNTCS